MHTHTTIKVKGEVDGGLTITEVNLQCIGKVEASDDNATLLDCPTVCCDDEDGLAHPLHYSRVGKFLFCRFCKFGFLEV